MNEESIDLERLAWDGAELPEGLDGPDTLYFQMLRALYQFARATDMDPEQGKREKGKIQEIVQTYRLHGWAHMTLRTGAARAAYRKARKAMADGTELYLPEQAVAVIAAGDALVEAMDRVKVEGANDERNTT